MAKSARKEACLRKIQDKEIHRKDAGLDGDEDILLTLSRFFFETFAVPETESWMRSFDLAACHFGPDAGAIVTQRLFYAIQAMRCARRSTFAFNAPLCHACSEILTEHERRLMAVIQNARLGRFGAVRMELMLLCEGNDTRLAEGSFASLCAVLPICLPLTVWPNLLVCL